MPQSSMTYDEIVAAFEGVHEQDLYATREILYTKPEGGKEYTAPDGAKLPKRGQIHNLDPFGVSLADFHDRKFGHSYGVRRNEKGEITWLGHVQRLALQLHDEGQLEDAGAVVRRHDDTSFAVQVWRGAGRTLATRLLILSGVATEAKLRCKVFDVVSEADPETMKALVTGTVNANLSSAGYSAVDKANIFKQMIEGSYGGVQYSQEEIARVTGVTPASISQLMNLTRMIPEIQRLIHEDTLGYAKALSLKLHKQTPEKQAEFVNSFLTAGEKKGKHAGENGAEVYTPKKTLTALIVWCEDVINSTGHKHGAQMICRELRDALTAASGPNIKRLDDTVNEHSKGR